MLHPLLIFLYVLCLVPTAAADGGERPKVLVIESYHEEYAWDREYLRALTELLGEQVELSFFQMDTKRLPPEHYPKRREAAWRYAQQVDPALYILGDDNALKLLGPRLVATGKPVIYLGINHNPRSYFNGTPSNVSGVLERPLLKRSIAYLNLVMGRDLSKVLVLFDNGTTAQTVLDESFGGLALQQIGTASVDIRLLRTEDEWQRAIRHAPAEGFDLVVIGLYHTLVDGNGRHVAEQRVIEWSAAHSKLPLFGFWGFSVGPGMTAGGLVLDAYAQGEAAAKMALDVLGGAPLPRLPVSTGGGRLLFSRSQLAHWGITLPARIAEQAELVP